MKQEMSLKKLFKKNHWLALNIKKNRIVAKVIKKIKANYFLLKASNSELIPKAKWIEIEFINCLIAIKTECYVEETVKEDEFLLKLNKRVKPMWERNHIRINIYQKTVFEIINKPFFKAKKFPVLIEDISASGAKLIVEMPLNEGYIINLNMGFSEFSFSDLRAEVVRKNKICQLKTRIYEVGVKFIICSNDRQELIKYINQKQLKLKMI